MRLFFVAVMLSVSLQSIGTFSPVLQAQGHRDLVATLAYIPGLAESQDEGTFVELVKAMDEVYPGKITIGIYPFARSFNNLLNGEADFHLPAMRNPAVDEPKLPYRYVSEIIGKLSMVLLSNIEKPITKQMVLDAIAQGGPFPYKIEVNAGAEENCLFPAISAVNLESSMRKLQNGRIDAIWNAQEETDLVLKRLKLNKIRREFWGHFEDVIVIQKNRRGQEVDVILSAILQSLRQSGKLQSIYQKVHSPYDDWQPAAMGW